MLARLQIGSHKQSTRCSCRGGSQQRTGTACRSACAGASISTARCTAMSGRTFGCTLNLESLSSGIHRWWLAPPYIRLRSARRCTSGDVPDCGRVSCWLLLQARVRRGVRSDGGQGGGADGKGAGGGGGGARPLSCRSRPLRAQCVDHVSAHRLLASIHLLSFKTAISFQCLKPHYTLPSFS